MNIKINFFIFTFIISICYFYYSDMNGRVFHLNILKTVANVVVPTIINNQSYFFVKTNYTNMNFYQCIRSNDYVSDFIKKKGIWPECQDIFDIYMSGRRDGVFVDFGANIGSCSFLFAQAGVRVYAFEPLPNNLFLFSLTTFSNTNFTKYITIYPYALGIEEKEQVMKITKNNWGFSSLYYNHTDYTEVIHLKKLDKFDKLVPNKISMIKIDVEGAEYDLIKGGKEFFRTHTAEFMHIEVTCGERDKYGIYEVENLYKILDKMGYYIVKKIDCKREKKENIVAKNKNIHY